MFFRKILGILALTMTAFPAAAQSEREVPYWASINVDEARMRKGPSPAVPVIWEYHRKYLPVKVVAVHEEWRKVVDPDGTEGWMAARLLSIARTAIVTGGTRVMRVSPEADANIAYRVEAGVVGRLGECRKGFCLLDVKGRKGWIAAAHIWGDD